MMRTEFHQWALSLQDKICHELEGADGMAKFKEDVWQRQGGGGGRTRVIMDGRVIEKGGVNVSAVFGEVTPDIRKQLKVEGERFYATGISLVIHPFNPMVPTVHANFRYFEVTDQQESIIDAWFGGGADLTPYYLFEEDIIHFHNSFRDSCNAFDAHWYPAFKKECDDYFVNHHRNGERRGVGGIFYDHLRPDDQFSSEMLFDFAQSNGESLIRAYLPIVRERKGLPFSESQKHWQLIRRGRYIEFNLIHDRGTLFGIKSNGRTESILMSLPKHAAFEYDYQPQPDSPEDALLNILLQPKEWL